uniref:AIG1-type G domain-containing protein n=1 Tax=Hucho hucho TaxID=62062 RepID=A0A4W5PQG5_9TELE
MRRGKPSLIYTMVLFTGGDQLEGKPVEDLLKDNSQLLQLISTCRGRYHVFNNKEKEHLLFLNIRKVSLMFCTLSLYCLFKQ